MSISADDNFIEQRRYVYFLLSYVLFIKIFLGKGLQDSLTMLCKNYYYLPITSFFDLLQ